jgi:hypothetical protein
MAFSETAICGLLTSYRASVGKRNITSWLAAVSARSWRDQHMHSRNQIRTTGEAASTPFAQADHPAALVVGPTRTLSDTAAARRPARRRPSLSARLAVAVPCGANRCSVTCTQYEPAAAAGAAVAL